VQFSLAQTEGETIARCLEGVVAGEEAAARLPDAHWIGECVKRLEADGAIETERLMRLEFALISALIHDKKSVATTLFYQVMTRPELFLDLICMIYKPRNTERSEVISKQKQQLATSAWQVLHHCFAQPGADRAGVINATAFLRFVDDVRVRCGIADRLEVCDSTLGEIMARGPSGEDGLWPCEPARDVLDALDHEDMRRGFAIGCFNGRGVVSRSMREGGEQERAVAAIYRQRAADFAILHPRLSEMFRYLADDYGRYGHQEDVEARLRRELR